MVDLSDLQVSRTAVVHAPAEALYDLISDVTRVGEISPVCTSAWWDEGSGPHVGGWFTGHNERPGRDPWERHCEVVLAEPGRAFGWVMGGQAEGSAEWTYQFRSVDGGTEVEESWRILRLNEVLRSLTDEQLNGMKEMTVTGIEQTLTNLKKVMESA